MSAPDDEAPPERKPEARTILMPGATSGTEPTEPAPPPAPPDAAAAWGATAPAAPVPPESPPPPPAAIAAQTGYMAAGGRNYAPMAPRTNGNRVEVGDVLNHIFEVKRFIARGGMGEVFEGVNVSSDERVAIKVMLPALAADPNVVAMFRKEARTLTKLAHPALVAYRVLAQEPQLDLLYIVTEYVDGVNLSDVLGELKPTPEELRGLARRLAEGLRAAHLLGAIHRDISPDNVLLEERRLDRAKIIDFGIAKDLDPTTKTIVGDGFAGKLNYVAPEQLGDFGRAIGPWTDVYSLALVILAVAQGRDSDMGATLVDAVDRRRAGPDLSKLPSELQPVLHAMLVADPANRLRSMDAVIAALDGTAVAPAPSPAVGKPAKAPKEPKPAKEPKPTREPRPAIATDAKPAASSANRWILIGGAVAALLLLVVVGVLMSGGKKSAQTAPVANTPAAPVAPAATKPPAERARAAIEAALPGISCSWLDIDKLAGDGSSVTFRGVAGDPAAASKRIGDALAATGLASTAVEFADVTTVGNTVCSAVDALRPIRATDGGGLAVKQPKFELKQDGDRKTTLVVLDLDLGPQSGNIAVLGIDPNGVIDVTEKSRADAENDAKNTDIFSRLHDNVYQVTSKAWDPGLTGVILLTMNNKLSDDDIALLTRPVAQRDAAWASKVSEAAARGGWRAQMVWYRLVDEVPG